MPAPKQITVAAREDFESVEKYTDYLAGLVARSLRDNNWLVSNLDSMNIKSLTADKIVTGTLLASLATIKSALSGATITIDGDGFKASYSTGTTIIIDQNGFTINDGSRDVFTVDEHGNAEFAGDIVAGANISVESDIHVGENVYIGDQSSITTKSIFFKNLAKIYCSGDSITITTPANVTITTGGTFKVNGDNITSILDSHDNRLDDLEDRVSALGG